MVGGLLACNLNPVDGHHLDSLFCLKLNCRLRPTGFGAFPSVGSTHYQMETELCAAGMHYNILDLSQMHMKSAQLRYQAHLGLLLLILHGATSSPLGSFATGFNYAPAQVRPWASPLPPSRSRRWWLESRCAPVRTVNDVPRNRWLQPSMRSVDCGVRGETCAVARCYAKPYPINVAPITRYLRHQVEACG
jgi:hypothetical protein